MSKSDRIAVLTVNSDVEPIISYVSSVNDGIREKLRN